MPVESTGNEEEHSSCPEDSSHPLLSDDPATPRTVSSDISDDKKLDSYRSDSETLKDNSVSEKCSLQERMSQRDVEENTVYETTKDDDEIKEAPSATVVIPPDGGWGWVVVAASFVCNFIVDGIIFSFGLFLEDITNTFDVPKSKVSVVGSLLSGFYLIAGPFVSALANRYGFRTVTIAGSILSAVAFALSFFSENMLFLYLTYGVLGGIGFGMIYAPSIITVGYYFEKWRALATGIAVCGSGIGTILLAPLCQSLIDQYGWRYTFLIQAVIVLICVVCGFLFRPIKPVRVTVEPEVEGEKLYTPPENLLQRVTEAREQIMKKSASVISIGDNGGKISDYPTAAEVLIPDRPDSTNTQTSKLSKSNQSLNNRADGLECNEENKRSSVPLFQEKVEQQPNGEAYSNNLSGSKKCLNQKVSSTTLDGKRERKRTRTTSECSSAGANRSRRETVTEYVVRSRRSTVTQLDTGVNRPLYRDDIFFASSLNHLPQYQSQRDLGYTMSVTRLPTKNDENEDRECRLCPESVRRTVATMLDWSLLKSPTFLILCVSGFLTLMGFYTPFMYLTDRAKKNGMEQEAATYIISAIGITNTVARVVCGLISNIPGVDALTINNIALTAGGIATMMSGLSHSTVFVYSYSAVFGLAIACFASLRSILLVDLLGLENLTNAFGLLLLFQGIAASIGAPIAGLFMEYTNSYDASFYLSGALILVSGILCYPLNAINRWEKKKSAEGKKSAIV